MCILVTNYFRLLERTLAVLCGFSGIPRNHQIHTSIAVQPSNVAVGGHPAERRVLFPHVRCHVLRCIRSLCSVLLPHLPHQSAEFLHSRGLRGNLSPDDAWKVCHFFIAIGVIVTYSLISTRSV